MLVQAADPMQVHAAAPMLVHAAALMPAHAAAPMPLSMQHLSSDALLIQPMPQHHHQALPNQMFTMLIGVANAHAACVTCSRRIGICGD